MAFLEEIDLSFDVKELIRLHHAVVDIEGLNTDRNQIAINNKDDSAGSDDQLFGASGGLADFFEDWREEYNPDNNKTLEFHWQNMNQHFKGTYMDEVFAELDKHMPIGRTRFMNMHSKQCYTRHRDTTRRFHIPLYTNEQCIFFDADYNSYHLEVGKVYLLDTVQFHTTANFGRTSRLHIVGAYK